MESYLPEVKVLTKLKHENLVNLVGWSCNKKELLIVYELVCKQDLGISSFQGDSPPDMGRRKTIARGLASALLYLHEEREQSVLHCDIKSDNILLDSNFGPKLCDFGLARPAEDEQESGYPTLWRGGFANACGKPAVEQFQENGMKFELKLVDWVCEKIERGENVSAVADPRLGLSL
ncbi:L-type lectin-domain containing receptor kinase IX.2-like [Populus alba x Populus x berolinensis]|uniref:L-type lectin-domain containing receptor kinase IX.2-like n=1 Tax=Populus alba x Populus x berolinensis TaxID=444605 RepID=A0AAD6LHY4_9ROSI|nr:L-type lectin-domain containing receptor kinase IX.2-like [Populus alba x Populus x berolinensis]